MNIYEYLEKNVKILYFLHSFASNILSAKEIFSLDDDKLKMDIENAIFSIVEFIEAEHSDIVINCYKIISQNYNYIIHRINQTKNPLLKAIYSEILYYSKEKQYRPYIQQAIENYYIILNESYLKLSNTSNDDFIHSIINTIKKLLYLAVKTKSPKLKDIKRIILKITQIKTDVHLYHYLIISTISEMLKYDKAFTKSDFIGIDDIFWNLSKSKFKKGEYNYVINIITQYANKIDNKLKKLSYPWDELIGKSYEKLMQKADSALVSRQWCTCAIKHYSKLNKYTNKIKTLEQKYISFKDKIELSNFERDFNPQSFIDIANEILKLSPMNIFIVLSKSDIFYPSIKNISDQYSICSSIFPTSYLDQNMHTSKVSSPDVIQDTYLSNFNTYWKDYQITIQHIFIDGIKRNLFNLQDLIGFFIKHSSYFDLITKPTFNKKHIQYNWSATLISIFETYFKEMKSGLKAPKCITHT